jgi:CHASE3 domain sensor protein
MQTKSLSNHTVQRAFGFAIVALLIVSAISYRGIALSSESYDRVRQSHEAIENLQDLLLEMRRVESSDRGFLLTGDENTLQSYRDAAAHADQLETTVRNLTVDNATRQRNITIPVQLAGQKIQFAESAIELRRTKRMEVAADYIRAGDGERIMGEFQDVLQRRRRRSCGCWNCATRVRNRAYSRLRRPR